MTEPNAYPPEWRQPPHPLDPVLGEELRPWRPSAGQRAQVAEQAFAYTARERQFRADFLQFCAERDADRSWPQAWLGLLELLRRTAVNAQGQQLTLARLVDDLDHAHDDRIQRGK